MASILDLLNTAVGEKFISSASKKTSEKKDNITVILAMTMPFLLGAIKANASTEEGSKAFNKTLDNPMFGESLLNNIENTSTSKLIDEGKKIIKQVLKGNEIKIVQIISDILKVEQSSVETIFQMAAPLVMSILSVQRQKESIGPGGLEELISSVLGKSSKFDSSLIETLLTQDDASDVINNAKEMILGGGTKGKKDGGILGGMLGSK